MDLYKAENALDEFARFGGIKALPAYYIWGEVKGTTADGEKLYTDEGHVYCEACADGLLIKLLPLVPVGERDQHKVSGTDLDSEDTCQHCMICGALLDYALNSTGLGSELDHFESQTEPVTDKLSPGEAYHIARMVEAVQFIIDGDEEQEADRQRVIVLAQAALARIGGVT